MDTGSPTPDAAAGSTEALQQLVHCLAAALGFEFTLIGVLDGDSAMVRSLACSLTGRPADLHYPLAGSPCEQTMGRGEFVVEDRAAAQFPRDTDLTDLGVRGYVGARFVDPVTGRVALVAGMSKQPVEDGERALIIARTFATSAAAMRQVEVSNAEDALVREALSSTGQGFMVVEADGRVVRASQEANALLPGCDGDGLRERLGRDGADVFAALSLGRAWSGRLRTAARDADGRSPILEVEIVPRHGPEPVCFVLLRDVTEAVEEADRLQVALDATGAGLWDWRILEDRIRTAGRYFQMLGYEARGDELGYQHFVDILHPDDQQRTFDAVQQVQAGEVEEYDIEFRLRCADGRFKWIRSFGRIVERAEDGRATRMVGYHVDVDPTRRRAERLEQAEQRLRLFVENTSAAIAMLDRDLCFMTASRGYRSRYGIHDLEGRRFEEVFDDLTDDWKGLMGRVLTGESLSKARARRHGIDGSTWNVRWAMRPWFQEDGTVGGMVIQVETIDAQIEHEQRLFEARDAAIAANRARGEFLANVSHEIRTPMTAILGFADLVDSPATSEAQRAEFLATMRRNGDHLLDIINTVLDLSKIDAGKFDVHLEDVDIAGFAEEVVRTFRSRAEEKGLEFRVQAEGWPDLRLRTDVVRLRQILTNVIHNAIKFTSDGWVELRIEDVTEAGVRKLVIEVEDSGIGMSPEQAKTIFEPFVQADGSSSRRFDGTGLGLSISRRLAEVLNGGLTATSRPGVGTTFHLVLPVLEALDGPQDRAPSLAPARDVDSIRAALPAAPLDGLRVLLADDGADNRRLLGLVLERAGADVVLAENGRGAVAEVEAADPPFDVVLMDMQMPELDGYEATRVLRSRACDLPIIALTAHAMQGAREECIEAGCDEYLAKPVDAGRLVHAIRTLLGSGAGRSRRVS
jgi:PAS domain S-box-containing protein